MRYNAYHPENFGIRGDTNRDESLAVLAEVENGRETGHAMLCYIYHDDPADPPAVDMDTSERFELPQSEVYAGKPVFEELEVSDDGSISLRAFGRLVTLSEEQEQLLSYPSCLQTTSGRFFLDRSESDPVYRKDEAVECIPKKQLDMREFVRAVSEKYPALLEKTHIYYGNHYPEFPNAKYFEDRDKMVVFIAKSQLGDIAESVLDCRMPLFRDLEREEDWDLKNTYGICIIDDTGERYSVSLISPFKLDLARDKYLKQRDVGRER